ncbi:MAG: hypothetical protein KJO69_03530 [Gammaproteobacteria bacterium]|nr:hypothetical protein [Gammaproteobacteria bacterium]
MDDATKKNFAVLQEAFNHMDRRLNEQELLIRNLQGTITMIKTELQAVTQHMQVLRAVTGGTGPTVRS